MYLDIAGMIMFQKQLRKEFTRALSKATLVVMLPLALAAGGPAAAQDISPAVAPETAVTEQVSAQDTIFLKEGETVSVLPENDIGVDNLEKRYPFLKELLADVRSYNEEFEDRPTVALVSTVRDTAQNIDMIFVSVQGPMTCGASQCQMNIFVGGEEGYKQAFAGAVPLPVMVHKDKGEVSVFFCSNEQGRAQFVLTDGALEHKGNVISPQTGPSCPRN
jgi:hypothetical protein